MDAFNEGMQACDVGESGFAQPMQLHFWAMLRKVGDGGERVDKVAHAG